MSLIKILTVLAASLLLILSQPKDPIMIGYTNFHLLPFLDGGALRFQVGERLWAMSLGEDGKIRLASPDGKSQTIYLIHDTPTLIKEFEEGDPLGEWILQTDDGRKLRIFLDKPREMDAAVRYDFLGELLVLRMVNSSRSVFLEAPGPKARLLIAGTENTILSNLSLNDGEYAADIIYPGDFVYRGKLEGSFYRFEAEPLVGRVVLRIENGVASLALPELHSVGAGGILPLRIGEAVLRVRLRESGSLNVSIYILDEGFKGFAGEAVGRAAYIPLEESLNFSVKILSIIHGKAAIIELRPPVASIKFYDPEHERLDNLTIRMRGLLSTVKNSTAYILLVNEEHLPQNLVRETEEVIDVYVNGFRAESLRIDLRAGAKLKENLTLRRLNVILLDPDGKPPRDARLKINGRSMRIIDGRCSYLLPPAAYKLEAEAPGLRGSVSLNLSLDTSLKLKLRRVYGIDDYLRIAAAVETAAIIFLTSLQLDLRRIIRGLKNKRL